MRKLGFAVLAVLACSTMLLFAQPVQEEQTLRIGIMPDVDSLPIQLAKRDGLYQTEGAAVELVLFHSPVERDAAFQAGKLDGMVGDTLGALFLRQAGFDGVITSITNGRYGIAASPRTTSRDRTSLVGKSVAVSSNTIIEYLADTLLSPTQVTMMAIPKIPVRMEMLLNGSLDAACLPEPFYALAVSQGAVPIADSRQLSEVPGVMVFTKKAVDSQKANLIGFYRAYRSACKRINADSNAYRDLLVEAADVPLAIKDSFEFVHYEAPRLPLASSVEAVQAWLKDRGLLTTDISYESLTDASVIEAL